MAVKNRRYVPDLRKLLGDCEINYHRLIRLLPALEDRDHWLFGVDANAGPLRQVSISVVERSRYTTTVAVAQESLLNDWVPKPTITVRLYHDAQMAEVLAFQCQRPRQSRYEYPNERMYQRDEKAQQNAFLGEWLEFCLRAGCALSPLRRCD